MTAPVNQVPPPELGEVASAGRRDSVAGGFVNRLKLSDDRILQSKGGNLEIYERILEDDQVYSTFQQRVRAITSRPWLVEPGGETPADEEAADFIRDQLNRIRWDEKVQKMASGLFYGYSVAEAMWAVEGGKVVLDKLKVRKAKRFRFNDANELVLLRPGKQPEVMPDRKFWVFSCGADNDDEPYGRGLAHWLYWPVWFKRNDIKFWLILIDKLGIPTAKGTFPKGATKEEQDKLLAALAGIQSEAAFVMPEGMIAELMEAARAGSVGQEELYDRMNAAISKVVLSQTMTTDDGSSMSQSQVHMDVRQDVTESDADLIDDSFTSKVVRWLCEWNFPNAAIPRVERNFEESEDANTTAERDQKLWDMGARPTQEYAESQYPGWKFPETAETMGQDKPTETVPGKPQLVAFAEPDQVDQLVTEILAADDWPAVMQAVIGPIEDLMNDCSSFEEFTGRCAEALAKMDAKTLAERMARALFAARIAGNVEAHLDHG